MPEPPACTSCWLKLLATAPYTTPQGEEMDREELLEAVEQAALDQGLEVETEWHDDRLVITVFDGDPWDLHGELEELENLSEPWTLCDPNEQTIVILESES